MIENKFWNKKHNLIHKLEKDVNEIVEQIRIIILAKHTCLYKEISKINEPLGDIFFNFLS